MINAIQPDYDDNLIYTSRPNVLNAVEKCVEIEMKGKNYIDVVQYIPMQLIRNWIGMQPLAQIDKGLDLFETARGWSHCANEP